MLTTNCLKFYILFRLLIFGLSREASFQAELYRILKNIIDKKFSVSGITFSGVEFEKPIDSGRADIVVLSSGRPFIVIETKRSKAERTTRNIDPLSPDVIVQALGYASMLGAPYVVTANPEYVASFVVPSRGEKLDITRHRVKFWELGELSEKFGKDLLETIALFHLSSEQDRIKIRTPLDWAFIIRLRSFVSWLSNLSKTSLKEKLRIDTNLKAELVKYFENRGMKFDAEQYSREVSYIFMNKIIFYKVLERHYRELPKLRPIEENNP